MSECTCASLGHLDPPCPIHKWDRGVRSDNDRGPGIRTLTGWFYPFDPRPEEVSIVDIAHALSMLCRFGGHVLDFYSVAQHSVLVSLGVPPDMALAALLHDAAEAYVGDVVSPIKRRLSDYSHIEDGVWCAIVDRFDLHAHGVSMATVAMPPEVKHADMRALVTEMRDLWSGPPEERSFEFEPWAATIDPLPPKAARALFAARWFELTGDTTLQRQDAFDRLRGTA